MKAFAIVVGIFTIGLFAACGGGGGDTKEPEATATATATADAPPADTGSAAPATSN